MFLIVSGIILFYRIYVTAHGCHAANIIQSGRNLCIFHLIGIILRLLKILRNCNSIRLALRGEITILKCCQSKLQQNLEQNKNIRFHLESVHIQFRMLTVQHFNEECIETCFCYCKNPKNPISNRKIANSN